MPKKHSKEERHRTDSASSRPSTSEEYEEPIELLSPKHNGNSVDGKQTNKSSSIKGMWKKAFKSIRHNKPKDGEKEKAEGDKDSKHSRTSSRQSSLKRVLRRKDSKDEKADEELARSEDPVYQTLKRAASIAVPGSSAGDSQPGSLDIVDEELDEYSPYVQASANPRSSFQDYH